MAETFCDTGDGHPAKGGKLRKASSMALLSVLGLITAVYSVFLLTGIFGKSSEIKAPRVYSEREKQKAGTSIEKLLANDPYGCIKSYHEEEGYLVVKVNSRKWRKLSTKKRKDFLKELAKSRRIIGLPPDVRIVSSRSGYEYASFENNRVTLAELDF